MDMAEDLVFNILLWLPVTSLLRFKAVCKSWRSIIESSAFISQHLHHHHYYLDDEDSWNLIALEPDQFQFTEWFKDLEFTLLSGNNFQFSQKLELQIKYETEHRIQHIIASCHGILCLDLGYDSSKARVERVYYPDLCLWNPATRQFFILPEPPVPIPDGLDVRYNYGFGFDDKTNDYKVVRFLIYDVANHIDSLRPASSPVNSRTDVYCLSTNSWRNVDAALPISYVRNNPQVPFRDGIYCWLGHHSYKEDGKVMDTKLIFSFDFTSEVFGTITPVPDIYDNGDSWLVLSYLREKIACIVWHHCDSSHCDSTNCQVLIWILNQYGVKDSWAKLYTITSPLKGCYPYGISKNGKLLWEKIGTDGLTGKPITVYLFDPVTQELKILPVDEPPSPNFGIVVYKESLVSIKCS